MAGGCRVRARWLRAVTLGVAVACASITAAHANDSPGGSGGAFVNDDGDPTAVANEKVSRNAPRGKTNADNCKWVVVVIDDTNFAVYDEEGRRLRSETGRWLQWTCNEDAQLVGGSYLVPQVVVQPRVLASEALASVAIPAPPIATSPSNDRLYAQVRTWLWLPSGWWRTYSATANAGGVSTTVTATPQRAVWSLGDGATTTCNGPGVEWRRGMRDDATYCSYTYRHSSAQQQGGKYTLSVTVWFEVTWTSNTGDSGALPAISRTASRKVEVGEVQALETG